MTNVNYVILFLEVSELVVKGGGALLNRNLAFRLLLTP
jgi:hypothetical protein